MPERQKPNCTSLMVTTDNRDASRFLHGPAARRHSRATNESAVDGTDTHTVAESLLAATSDATHQPTHLPAAHSFTHSHPLTHSAHGRSSEQYVVLPKHPDGARARHALVRGGAACDGGVERGRNGQRAHVHALYLPCGAHGAPWNPRAPRGRSYLAAECGPGRVDRQQDVHAAPVEC